MKAAVAVLMMPTLVASIACEDNTRTVSSASAAPVAAPSVAAAPSGSSKRSLKDEQYQVLYVPTAGDQAIGTAPKAPQPVVAGGRCPTEMVSVADAFCIDRFESMFVDKFSRREMSPYYSPQPGAAKRAFKRWLHKRHTIGPASARTMPLPEFPSWQHTEAFEPVATVRKGVVPAGHVSGKMAEVACKNAGKRLCTESEWTKACRGEADQAFPYGNKYEQGTCNVFQSAHPADLLHDDPSIGHQDPRLNQVKYKGQPLLKPTGATATCASKWGADAVYDMVGNVDEWVASKKGVFRGGFYSRSTRSGCAARVSSHDSAYYDYSLGVRCCK